MSILDLFINKRIAANERRDKELIKKTLTKNPSFVLDEYGKITNRLEGFLSSRTDSLRYQNDTRRPQFIKREILWQLEPVFDLLGIDLELETAKFENQFNPSVDEFLSYIKDLYDTVNVQNPIKELPELTDKIVDKKTDEIWEDVVGNPTGKRYSNQILLWWSRGSTAQNIKEDLTAIVDSIKLFEKHKKSLPKDNISQYKRWDQLNEALEPIRVAEAAENRELRLQVGETVDELVDYTEEQKEFMDPKQKRFPGMGLEYPEVSPDLVIKKINTFEEAKALGEGTTWCFTNSPNYYSQYSNRGPIYIILENGDPKVGIGIDYDWDIEVKNSNNANLNSEEQKLYGPLVKRITKLEDMVEALEDRDGDGERVIYDCSYCNSEVYGYGNDDDPWWTLSDEPTCEYCFDQYSCRLGDYEHGWQNPDGSFQDPRDEEVGPEIGSCWECATFYDSASQCLVCKDIIYKEDPHYVRTRRDVYFYSEELDGDLCEYCGIQCSVCKRVFVNENDEDEMICKDCRQMEFPELEDEPFVQQQPVGPLTPDQADWQPGFFPQGE